MSLGPGTRLGPYEIVSALGAGGMGEVYRATDTSLGRHVAIKVLPDALAHDVERLARFEREAKTLAALNHPHIAQIYGLEKSSGVHALVMELVEGEDLSQRIARGPIPIDEALPIAEQIAEALEAAHEQGIVHRDLKPANIKVTPDGVVKVLDFGLAKLSDVSVGAGGSSAAASLSPTITSPALMTGMGVLLGTAAYMAPEQAKGKPADKRSDIWSFGCVLYEMLTGARAFDGEDVTDTLAAVVRGEPRWDVLPGSMSPSLRAFLRRCLQKDPKQRVHDIADVRLALEGAFETGGGPTAEIVAVRQPRRRAFWVGWALAAAFAVAAIALGIPYLRTAPGDAPAVRFSVVPPPNVLLSTSTRQTVAVVSPDGRRVAFVAIRVGATSNLWVRPLGALEAQPLAGTDSAMYPFWSPDGRSIAFFANGKLRTIDLDTGQVLTLCDALIGTGGAWSQTGMIVFAPANATALFQVPATGGQPTAVTRVDSTRRQVGHRFPAFLPDGRHFVFSAYPSNTIWLGSLDSKETTQLVAADSQGQYAAPGYLLFVRQGTLLAQRFDDRAATLTGDAVPVAQQVPQDGNGYAAFSTSGTGTLAYRTGAVGLRTQLTWFDRSGRAIGTVGQPGFFRNPTLAPDGTRVAVEVVDPDGRNQDIWIGDLARGVLARFTFDPHNDIYAVWSADGNRIMFASDRDGGIFNVYQKAANGAGDEQRLVKSTDDMAPYSRSPDGRFLTYRLNTTNTGILPLIGDRTPRPLLQSAGASQSQSQVSPNGRWLAYASNESGRYEVYLRSFPDPTDKWQVSQGGGVVPKWRGDGRELYYYAADERLVAVPIAGDAAAEIGAAVPLFETHMLNGAFPATGFRAQYDVTRDGQRFLINMPLEQDAQTPITVVLNWQQELKRLVPFR